MTQNKKMLLTGAMITVFGIGIWRLRKRKLKKRIKIPKWKKWMFQEPWFDTDSTYPKIIFDNDEFDALEDLLNTFEEFDSDHPESKPAQKGKVIFIDPADMKNKKFSGKN